MGQPMKTILAVVWIFLWKAEEISFEGVEFIFEGEIVPLGRRKIPPLEVSNP